MTIKRFATPFGAMLAIKPSALDREYGEGELAANRAANNRITVHRAAAKPVAKKKDAPTMKKTLKNVLADLGSIAESGSPSERKTARQMVAALAKWADEVVDGASARAPKSKLSAAEGEELDRRMGIQRKPRGGCKLDGTKLVMR